MESLIQSKVELGKLHNYNANGDLKNWMPYVIIIIKLDFREKLGKRFPPFFAKVRGL